MPRNIDIFVGVAIDTSWKPEVQKGVTPVDVIVLHPGEADAEELYVAQHSTFEWEGVPLDIISAVARIQPSAVLGLLDKSYTDEEILKFIREAGDAPIRGMLKGKELAVVSSNLRFARTDNVTQRRIVRED